MYQARAIAMGMCSCLGNWKTPRETAMILDKMVAQTPKLNVISVKCT